MEKIKIKPCPFCGCDQVSIGYDSIRFNAFVYCDQCRAFGPNVSNEDIGPIGLYMEVDPEKIKNMMIDRAVELWNARPDMTNYTAEDLETFEKGLKLKGVSLYGSSIYEK